MTTQPSPISITFSEEQATEVSAELTWYADALAEKVIKKSDWLPVHKLRAVSSGKGFLIVSCKERKDLEPIYIASWIWKKSVQGKLLEQLFAQKRPMIESLEVQERSKSAVLRNSAENTNPLSLEDGEYLDLNFF